MSWIEFSCERPEYLALLGLLPVIWWISRRSLASLSPARRWLALGARWGLLTLLALALAEVQLVRITERVAAMFLLDQSESIAQDQRAAAFDYVSAAVGRDRDPSAGDMAGVIVFGRDAQIEHPPSSFGALPRRAETSLDPSHTNLAGALRLAGVSLPPGMARRVVILSDGNQNLGDAVAEARELVHRGVGIDVAPLEHAPRSDVIVDKVTSPAAARFGVPFDVSIVLERRLPAGAQDRPVVTGRLLVTRRADGQAQLVADQRVSLPPGKQVFSFRQEIMKPAFFTYEASFVPDDPEDDKHVQNNRASGFTYVRGRGRILFIINSEDASEFEPLIAALRRSEMEVVVQSTSALFSSLSELQNFDAVVLANVPRTSGNAAETLDNFSDEQIDMLVQNVEQFGAGLVMVGGPDSFGAGGWANTALERAMPVDFQVKNSELKAVGALMLVIDKSGSMQGLKLDMARSAAAAAVGMLGPRDQIGVVAFDSGAEELVRLQPVGAAPARIKSLIGRLGSGGGTNMEPGMRLGYGALLKADATVKHMIVLTDGQTEGSSYDRLVASMRRKGITTTTVAVGNDAARPLLQGLATRGGGKFYLAVNPKVLPLIFTRETRRVVRPLVFEDSQGLLPRQSMDHEILAGIADNLPPITGYVLTTIKDNPLVEVPLVASKPAHPNNALLAAWNYGLGRTVAITTDGGQRWARSWQAWEGYDKLFVQSMRWAMRPIHEQGSFQVATQQQDGKLTILVHALTAKGDFLSGLPVEGSLVRDDGGAHVDLEFRQEGPGRYVATSPLSGAATHLLSIWPGPGHPIFRSGVNIPYSPEFRDQFTNEDLLLSLASMRPPGGKPGEVVRLPNDTADWQRFAGPNHFRRDLPRGQSLTGIWPLFILAAAGLFLLDVGNRRVIVPWGELGQWLTSLAGQSGTTHSTGSPLDRLRGVKQQTAQLRRHMELPAGERSAGGMQEADFSPSASPAVPSASDLTPTPVGDDNYADRLLRAKREARARAENPRNALRGKPKPE